MEPDVEIEIDLGDELAVAVDLEEDLDVEIDFEGSITNVIQIIDDCPIIEEIDGGNADGEEQYQHINGYLNGGDAEQP